SARQGEELVPVAAPVAIPVAQGSDKGGAAKTDAEKLIGTWRFTSALANGESLPQEFIALARLTFSKDGKAAMLVGSENSEGNYKVIAPGKIDLTTNKRAEPGPGIYQFDGNDKLSLSFAKDPGGKKRPTEFNGG